MISKSYRRMTAARASMVLDPNNAFWGMLTLRLALREDPTCETAWTDGVTLGFNPVFVEKQTHAQLVALWAHEVDHCAHGHPWRRDARDNTRWNKACDRAINPELRDAGFTLPAGALYELEPSHHGKSAEWIFNRLPPEPEGGGGKSEGSAQGEQDAAPSGAGGAQDPGDGGRQGQGAADGPGDPLGEVRDAPATGVEGEPPPTEEDWKQAVQQAAAAARARGNMPGGLERMVKAAARTRYDWRAATRRFAQEVARSDYSWTRPNPRYVASGWYLPGLRSAEMGVMVVAMDTSGSVDKVLQDYFGSEILAVQDDVRPRQIHVVHADARVQRVDVFERDEPVVLRPRGGGGTDFRPVFDYVAAMEEPPACVIYLTDLDGTFPEADPGVPTLWVTGREDARPVPFGEVVVADC
jgi:predicted metal-dependent peptidase